VSQLPPLLDHRMPTIILWHKAVDAGLL